MKLVRILFVLFFTNLLFACTSSIEDAALSPAVAEKNSEAPVVSAIRRIDVNENTITVFSVSAEDPDDGDLSFVLSNGNDSSKFTINSVTGELSFRFAPDFENPIDANKDNQYITTIEVSNSHKKTDFTVTVTVKDVEQETGADTNSPPIVARTTYMAIDENNKVIVTLTAQDSELDVLTWKIAGGLDAELLNLHTNSGELSFVGVPDYEAPVDKGADNSYEVDISVSDGRLAVVFPMQIVILDANDPPVFTSSTTFDVSENTTVVSTIVAQDYENDTLIYSIVSGNDAAHFTIGETTGNLSFIDAPNYEKPADVDTNNTYQVIVSVSDGIEIAQTSLVVSVRNVIEAPVITGQLPLSMNKNTTLTLSLNDFEVTDFDKTYPTRYRIIVIPNSNYSVSGTTITPTSNYTGLLSVPVKVSNEAVTSTVFTASIKVTGNIPIFTSPSTYDQIENTSYTWTIEVTDNTSSILQYTLVSGGDSALFTLFGSNEKAFLNFIVPPDFESPMDKPDGMNTYEVAVDVTNIDGVSRQNIIVNVLDHRIEQFDPNFNYLKGWVSEEVGFGHGVVSNASGVILAGQSVKNGSSVMTVWAYDSQNGMLHKSFGNVDPVDASKRIGFTFHHIDSAIVSPKQDYANDIASVTRPCTQICIPPYLKTGGIIVVGAYLYNTGDYDIAIWKIKSGGILDTTFGDNDPVNIGQRLGYTTFRNASGNDYANAVVIKYNGKITVAGSISDGNSSDMAIWQFTSDGQLDTTFGDINPANPSLNLGYAKHHDAAGSGLLTTNDRASGMDIMGNYGASGAKLAVAGSSRGDMVTWVYTAEGKLATTFGTPDPANASRKLGYITHDNAARGPVGGDDEATSIVWVAGTATSSSLLVAGHSQGIPGDTFMGPGTGTRYYEMVVWKLTDTGQLDTTFGDINPTNTSLKLGYSVHASGIGNNHANDITLTTNGTIVVVGDIGGAWKDLGVWHLMSNGMADTAWGFDDQTNLGNKLGYITHHNAAEGLGGDDTALSVSPNGRYVTGYSEFSRNPSNKYMSVWKMF